MPCMDKRVAEAAEASAHEFITHVLRQAADAALGKGETLVCKNSLVFDCAVDPRGIQWLMHVPVCPGNVNAGDRSNDAPSHQSSDQLCRQSSTTHSPASANVHLVACASATVSAIGGIGRRRRR